jgi:hypothetical protein
VIEESFSDRSKQVQKMKTAVRENKPQGVNINQPSQKVQLPEIRNWQWSLAKAGKRARKRRGPESSAAGKGPGKEIK